jgi:hypothetical protein
MMQQMFPRSLLACISEGRTPSTDEIEDVTEKILHEAFGGSPERLERMMAAQMARAALNGRRRPF